MRVIFTKTKFFCGLSALILAVAPMQLSAQQSSSDEKKYYVGLKIQDIHPERFTVEDINFEVDGTAVGVFIGQRLAKNISAEISYAEADFSFVANGVSLDSVVDASGKSSSIILLTYVANLESFKPFIGLGYASSDLDFTVGDTSFSSSDTGGYYIIGADITGGDNFSVRISYETCGDCFDAVSIGPIYRF